MGRDQDHEEIKEPVENLAKEITQKYSQELTREAIKKALKNKTRNLTEKEIKNLEKELKNLTEEGKVTYFKEASDEITKDILEGNITGEKAIEQMSGVLENSLRVKPSFLYRAVLSLKNVPLPLKIAIYIMVPILAATALFIMPSLSISEGDMSYNLAEGESGSGQFQVYNAGAGVLLWTASSDQPWITLSPKRGANTGNVIILVDAEDMEKGTYEGTITIESLAGTEECQVELVVENGYLEMLVYPHSFEFHLAEGEVDTRQLQISKEGSGTLEWDVSSGPECPWASLNRESGTNSDTLTLTASTEELEAGTYEGTLTIESNAGTEQCPMRLVVESQPPVLAVDPLSIDFELREGESDEEDLEISNDGEGILEWEVRADKPWITLDPGSGTNSTTVTVTVNTEELNPGEEYEGTITIESNGGEEESTVYLNVLQRIEEEPILAVDPDPLYLNFELIEEVSDSEEFYISNEGEGILEWEVSADEPWITLEPESGTNSGTVTVTIDTDDMSLGEEYEGNITIESNGGDEEGTVNLVLPGDEPILAVDPEPLYFSFELVEGESDSEEFYISNDGEGILEWEVRTDEAWITLDPESGTNSETVTVTMDTDSLNPGEEYEGNITIESNGGYEEGTIYLVLSGEEPILAVDPDPIYFNFELVEGESDSEEFYISNEGEGILEWEVHADEAWITLDPESGTNSETVTVTVDAGDLSLGEEHEGNITIESNGGEKEGTIYLVLQGEEPILVVDPDPLYFNFDLVEGESDSKELYISNGGGGVLEWKVLVDPDLPSWISVEPRSGTNSETVTVTVTVEATNLLPNEYSTTFKIVSNGGDEKGTVNLSVLPAYKKPMLAIRPEILHFFLN
ncbi:BACON domain-containing protein [Methanosarcina sp. Mfa9]|uniref:BACON domain-containing protein n=1 Tax=Methanosarcina sp. Mfa9 TaxID=3439063 RepID=UPI003F83358D